MKPLGTAVRASDCSTLAIWNSQFLTATWADYDCQFHPPHRLAFEKPTPLERFVQYIEVHILNTWPRFSHGPARRVCDQPAAAAECQGSVAG
jgi:hypothetical protein